MTTMTREEAVRVLRDFVAVADERLCVTARSAETVAAALDLLSADPVVHPTVVRVLEEVERLGWDDSSLRAERDALAARVKHLTIQAEESARWETRSAELEAERDALAAALEAADAMRAESVTHSLNKCECAWCDAVRAYDRIRDKEGT